MTRTLRPLAAALLAAFAGPLGAQGNASAAASAMGDAYTALARNFNAAAWNPANLGLPGNSRFSIALSPHAAIGTGPITLGDLRDWEGQVVPTTVREQWLANVIANGGQQVNGTADVTPLALSIGPVALAVTTTVRADGAVPAAVAELLLFGNAGRTGVPQDYTLGDLALDANATTTVALSYGRRLPIVPVGRFAVGVTGKYIVGHGLASMRDNGSLITSDPIAVQLDAPMVLTDTGTVNNGRGIGLDVGAAWTVGSLRTGLVLQNVVHTFKWDTERLYYLPMRATYDDSDRESDIDDILPLASADPALRDQLTRRVAAATVPPTLALGAAWTGLPRLTLAADVRQRLGNGLELGPRTQLGLGAEFRPIGFLPLRAGVTAMNGGMRYGGGFGLEFGVVNLQVSAALRDVDGRSDTVGGFTLSFGGR